jgi:hypothetical protein
MILNLKKKIPSSLRKRSLSLKKTTKKLLLMTQS